jgi:hypothetical protein
MRTTVNLDNDLLEKARTMSGISETGPLLKAALQALIYRESSLALMRLGGSQPNLQDIPRRRPELPNEPKLDEQKLQAEVVAR